MKIGQNLSFNGVEVIYSAKLDSKNHTYEKFDKNRQKALKRAEILKGEGRDVFVIEGTNRDYQGKMSNEVETFILTDEHAKILNKFDDIKKDLYKMFQPVLMGDRFVNHFDNKISEINTTQLLTAEMIAQSFRNKQN